MSTTAQSCTQLKCSSQQSLTSLIHIYGGHKSVLRAQAGTRGHEECKQAQRVLVGTSGHKRLGLLSLVFINLQK